MDCKLFQMIPYIIILKNQKVSSAFCKPFKHIKAKTVRGHNVSPSLNRVNYQQNVFLFHDFMSDFREIVKLRPFLGVRKNFKLLVYGHIIYHFKARDLENQNILFVSRNI